MNIEITLCANISRIIKCAKNLKNAWSVSLNAANINFIHHNSLVALLNLNKYQNRQREKTQIQLNAKTTCIVWKTLHKINSRSKNNDF